MLCATPARPGWCQHAAIGKAHSTRPVDRALRIGRARLDVSVLLLEWLIINRKEQEVRGSRRQGGREEEEEGKEEEGEGESRET